MFHQVLRPALGAIVAAAAAISAAPAFANPGVAAAATASLRPVATATATSLGSGDEQFRSLFASWQALDQASAAPTATASIPSRIPIDGYRLTSAYGMRVHPVTGGRRAHKGLDMASPAGTPIYAAADGVVGKAAWFGAYGLYVQLEHGGDMETRYGHMSRVSVAAGQRIRKGDLIGFVGSTGRSTGPHLHYEVRLAGEAVNPIPYLQQGGRAQAFALLDSSVSGQGGPE